MTRPMTCQVVPNTTGGEPKCDCAYDEATHLEFLKGAHDANPHSKQQLVNSLAALQNAVNANAKYARGISELAYTKVLAAVSSWFTPQERIQAMQEADALSQQAVAMQGHHDYTTHWSRGYYLCNTGNPLQFDEGLAEFDVAEQLFKTHTDPMDRRSGLLVEFGEMLVFSGDPAKIQLGIEKIEKALTPPDWYLWTAAFAYYAAQQYDKATEYLNRMQAQPGDPGYMFPALLTQAAILVETNERVRADEAMLAYFREGRRSLQAHAEQHKLEPIADAVERILNNEFRQGGFKDEGKTPLSKRWLSSLKIAFERVVPTLVEEGFNVAVVRPNDE